MLSKPERTRQFIIEKAAPVFNSKGYSGTSMNDLTGATGLTKGSIYGNFENKDEVALAAFDYNFSRVSAFIKSKIAERASTIGKLLVYPETYRHFLKLPVFATGCPILNTSTEADDTHPALKAKAANALKVWKGYLQKHILYGIEIKEIKADTNAPAFASIFISLIEGSIMQAKTTGKTTELNATMDFLENLVKNLKR
jgi:AcrR family transcriptional regulator